MKRKEELEALRDIKEKAKSAEKIIRSLAFRNQDIDFDVKINKSYRHGVLPYYLDFFFDIDVDKHFEKSPTYDKQYADATWEWEDRVESALRYVNLQNYYGGILFDYINDDLVSMEIERLNHKLEKNINFGLALCFYSPCSASLFSFFFFGNSLFGFDFTNRSG